MKKTFVNRPRLLWPLMLLSVMLTLSNCTKDDSMVNPSNSGENVSRGTRSSDFHWICKKCFFLNQPWAEKCLSCKTSYSPEHGGLVLTFRDILERWVDYGLGVPTFKIEEVDDATIRNRIILPGGYLADFAPQPWFDTYKAQTYYNNLKTLGYYSDAAYAEGVDVAWYRTVRMLYPGVSDVTKIQSAHAKWLLSEGRFMKDSKGRGIKDGTKAAIDAFANR